VAADPANVGSWHKADLTRRRYSSTRKVEADMPNIRPMSVSDPNRTLVARERGIDFRHAFATALIASFAVTAFAN
jgi:hypothetical protein